MAMAISVRDLHNDMIKPFDNGGLASVADSVTHKLMINDTKFRSFIPPKVCEMTPKLRQICVYELCTITKDIQIDINKAQNKTCKRFTTEACWDTHTKQFIYYYKC